MKYFPSDYLNAIASREPRLSAIDRLEAHDPSEMQLIEESQLARLEQVDFFAPLIVLTEDSAPPVLDPHFSIHKFIYKYLPLSRLRAELFSDRHRITWYTSTVEHVEIADFCADLAEESSFHDFCLRESRNASLLSPVFAPGSYRWIDSPMDCLDPPIDCVSDTLLRFAQEGTVGILSMPLKGELDRLFASLSDEVVIFLREWELDACHAMFPEATRVIPIVIGYSAKQICWRRKEDAAFVKRRLLEIRSQLR